MKINRISFYILLYSFLVLLSGIMAFFHNDQSISLFIEIIGAVFLFIAMALITKWKKYTYYFILAITFALIFFYGYMFASTKDFFAGFLAMVSVFFASAILSEIFK